MCGVLLRILVMTWALADMSLATTRRRLGVLADYERTLLSTPFSTDGGERYGGAAQIGTKVNQS